MAIRQDRLCQVLLCGQHEKHGRRADPAHQVRTRVLELKHRTLKIVYQMCLDEVSGRVSGDKNKRHHIARLGPALRGFVSAKPTRYEVYRNGVLCPCGIDVLHPGYS